MEGKSDKEMQRRAEYFMDVLQLLDNFHDICGMIDVMSGLRDFHVKRLKDRIWVFVEFMNRMEFLQRN